MALAVRFDSTIPVELQLNDYSCSVGATYWCLRSLALPLTQQELEDVMVPALVSPDLGLLDASGTGIVGLLRNRYGLGVSNTYPCGFDEIAARAGKQPIAIGGSRWFADDNGNVIGHWVAVRGFDGAQLLLANPGGTGPHFGQQVLDRAAFDQRAPFAAVWIDAVPGVPVGRKFRVGNTGGQGANLRGDASATASIVRPLADGTELGGGDHAWRAVTDSAGTHGWIANDFLSTSTSGFVVGNTGGSGANLRSSPSSDAAVVKLLADATQVTGEQSAWRSVTDSSGASGWVADDYLLAES